MTKIDYSSLTIDKSALSVRHSFDDLDEDDKRFWLSKTPQERLQHIEHLRRVNYGDRATARLQRVLEVTQRE